MTEPVEGFRPVEVNQRWTLQVPDWLAEWDVWPDWERERLADMAERLKPGDVLYDVGAEVGWMSALFGQLVGPSSLCIFEGSPRYWPHILKIWEANHDLQPRGCWPGLVGHQTVTPPLVDYDHSVGRGVWPACATGEPSPPGERPYRYLHGHGAHTLQVTLDDWCGWTGNAPAGISIDVEGAEFRVLYGARGLMREFEPVIWVSVHPELMERDYRVPDRLLHELMAQQGYVGTHLATDHEEHWRFDPQ